MLELSDTYVLKKIDLDTLFRKYNIFLISFLVIDLSLLAGISTFISKFFGAGNTGRFAGFPWGASTPLTLPRFASYEVEDLLLSNHA